MRILKLGECGLLAIIGGALFLGASAIAEGTEVPKPLWSRQCFVSLSKDKTTLVYDCGKDASFTEIVSPTMAAAVTGAVFVANCRANQHAWPFNKVTYSCGPEK